MENFNENGKSENNCRFYLNNFLLKFNNFLVNNDLKFINFNSSDEEKESIDDFKMKEFLEPIIKQEIIKKNNEIQLISKDITKNSNLERNYSLNNEKINNNYIKDYSSEINNERENINLINKNVSPVLLEMSEDFNNLRTKNSLWHQEKKIENEENKENEWISEQIEGFYIQNF